MKKKLSLLFALSMILASVGCGTNANESESSSVSDSSSISDSSGVEESESKEVKSEESTMEKQTESEAESQQESGITIVSHSLSKDYEDKDVLVIEYAYTNIEDEAMSFLHTCQNNVFQNGIECSSSVMGCDEIDIQPLYNDVQPGATYNIKVGYLLQDMTNAHVVITDFFGNKTLLEETIDLGGGEGIVVDTENLQETYVKVTGHHMSKDYKDDDVLIVDYEYYNGSDEAKSFFTNFSDKAFQNGVECDDMVLGCDEIDLNKPVNSIQPGVTLTFSKGYIVSDMSDVEIKVEGIILDDTEYVSEIISLS